MDFTSQINYEIILASQSPRRRELMTLAGIPHKVVSIDVDEIYPLELAVENVPEYLAELKSNAYNGLVENQLLITADTVVILDDRIYGKPKDRDDAVQMLNLLQGNTHKVITGVCLKSTDRKKMFAVETDVTFYPMELHLLEFYVDNYKPYDKAGSYAVQEWIGVHGIKQIDGDYFNVMGLPVSRMVRELRDF
ncbi:MAG TPA: Maf family nucleotide pyrophosphatase [Chitinophagales bacterium]|nr:Maf family nucleotide pyrophosphatase [Chitinophagales bacterium]